jgi:hypothetical protein
LKATILKQAALPGIHSASGVEVLGDRIYIVGDDSAHLYVLDLDWQPVSTIRLFDSPVPDDEPIPKAQKPDLEALTLLPLGDQTVLLAIGSGSLENRQDAFVIHPGTGVVQRHSLAPLYDHLRTLPGVVGTRLLNLEGAVVTGPEIVFLQRGNVSGTNVAIGYATQEFGAWLTAHGPLPRPVVRSYVLPTVEGYAAGFSGAAPLPSRPGAFLFTASVEATNDEILDGEMLGSFVGIAHLDQPGDLSGRCVPILHHQQAYPGKVESICLLSETATTFQALAVTDADGGESELLLLEIELVDQPGLGSEWVGSPG